MNSPYVNPDSFSVKKGEVFIKIEGDVHNSEFLYAILFNPNDQVKIASGRQMNQKKDFLAGIMKAMLKAKIERGMELSEEEKKVWQDVNKNTYVYLEYNPDNYFCIANKNGFPFVNKESIGNLIDSCISALGEDLFYALNPKVIGFNRERNVVFEYIDGDFPDETEEQKAERKKKLQTSDSAHSRIYILQISEEEDGIMGIEVVKIKKEIFEDSGIVNAKDETAN